MERIYEYLTRAARRQVDLQPSPLFPIHRQGVMLALLVVPGGTLLALLYALQKQILSVVLFLIVGMLGLVVLPATIGWKVAAALWNGAGAAVILAGLLSSGRRVQSCGPLIIVQTILSAALYVAYSFMD